MLSWLCLPMQLSTPSHRRNASRSHICAQLHARRGFTSAHPTLYQSLILARSWSCTPVPPALTALEPATLSLTPSSSALPNLSPRNTRIPTCMQVHLPADIVLDHKLPADDLPITLLHAASSVSSLDPLFSSASALVNPALKSSPWSFSRCSHPTDISDISLVRSERLQPPCFLDLGFEPLQLF